MKNLAFFLAPSLSSFIIALIFIPAIIKLADSKKWYDHPDERKTHTGLIPMLGGVGIFISYVLSSVISFLFVLFVVREKISGDYYLKLIFLFTGSLSIHILGLVDDFHNIPARIKLVLQILISVLIVAGGMVIKTVSIPFIGNISLGFLSYPVTILWIVGFVNAMNFSDGIDGYAGGIAGIAALSLGVIWIIQGHMVSALLAFSIFGAVSGFLYYNFPPARIFMGDSGSLLLGFIIAVLPLIEISKSEQFGILLVPVILLMVPVLDIASSIIRRIRAGRHPFSPDKGHIHFRLIDMGLSQRKILAIIFPICFFSGRQTTRKENL